MNFSRAIYESKPSHFLLATAQKVAIAFVFPIALIIAVEAIVKNAILINLLNTLIAILNTAHDLCTQNIWKQLISYASFWN